MPQGSSAVKPTNGLYLYLSQQTNIYASGGIRTHDLRRRAAVDLHLRPRGYWDRHINIRIKTSAYTNTYFIKTIYRTATNTTILNITLQIPSRESAATRLLGLRDRIPPVAWMSGSCVCCVFSATDLYMSVG